MEKRSIIKTVLVRNLLNRVMTSPSTAQEEIAAIRRTSGSYSLYCDGTSLSITVEQSVSTRNSIVTSQYPVPPLGWFNKRVQLREEAWSDLQKGIGLARPMNLLTLQQAAAHSKQTSPTQILLQLCKQFKLELSPNNILTLLPNLEQQRLAVSAGARPMDS